VKGACTRAAKIAADAARKGEAEVQSSGGGTPHDTPGGIGDMGAASSDDGKPLARPRAYHGSADVNATLAKS